MDLLPNTDTIERLRREFDAELGAAATDHDLQAVRDRYLSRKGGLVTALLKAVAAAPAADRPALGRLVNDLKARIETRVAEQRAALDVARPPAGAIDVTLPGRIPPFGHRHPLTLVRERMETIFTRMGFTVVEGPEAEDEWHCFDALNMPAEHPARDMQDTLYLASPIVGNRGNRGDGERDNTSDKHDRHDRDDLRTMLRTHTSSIQIRYMQNHQPPIRIQAPGRVYRRDDLDLTHTPMFTQMEGLVVAEGVSLSDLFAAAGVGNGLESDAVITAELEIKYAGYFERERLQADRMKRMGDFVLDTGLDYNEMQSLSFEARQKLAALQPRSLAQASRVPGVSPSDLQNLVIEVERRRRQPVMP